LARQGQFWHQYYRYRCLWWD